MKDFSRIKEKQFFELNHDKSVGTKNYCLAQGKQNAAAPEQGIRIARIFIQGPNGEKAGACFMHQPEPDYIFSYD